MKLTEKDRPQIVAQLNAIADSWGMPRLSANAAANATLSKLAATLRRMKKQGEECGTFQA